MIDFVGGGAGRNQTILVKIGPKTAKISIFFLVDSGSPRPPGGHQHHVRPYFGSFDPLQPPVGWYYSVKWVKMGPKTA